MTEEEPVFVVVWFDRTEWTKLKKSVDDPENLDDSYDEWRHSAESAIHNFRAEGKKVKKVSIKVDKLLYWCNEKGISPNSSARSEYVALLAGKEL